MSTSIVNDSMPRSAHSRTHQRPSPPEKFSVSIGKELHATRRREILDKYPKNDLIDDAQYQIGYVWSKAARQPEYDQTAAQKGIEAFQDYLARFKRSDKTEQATENIAMLQQRLSGGSLSVAKFYDKAGNYPAALVYYNEVLTQTPDSPAGQEARQRKRVLEDLISETKQQTQTPDKSKISFRSNPQAQPRNVPNP